jgi:hypothetical protein
MVRRVSGLVRKARSTVRSVNKKAAKMYKGRVSNGPAFAIFDISQ